MEESPEQVFEEFMSFCSKCLRGENPKFLDLIQAKFDACDDMFKNSQKMIHLLRDTQRNMRKEESRKFVHLKDLITELKAWAKTGKKKKGKERKRKRELPWEEDDQQKMSKFPKLKDCCIALEKIDVRPEVSDSECESGANDFEVYMDTVKEHSCRISDGNLGEAFEVEVANNEQLEIVKEELGTTMDVSAWVLSPPDTGDAHPYGSLSTSKQYHTLSPRGRHRLHESNYLSDSGDDRHSDSSNSVSSRSPRKSVKIVNMSDVDEENQIRVGTMASKDDESHKGMSVMVSNIHTLQQHDVDHYAKDLSVVITPISDATDFHSLSHAGHDSGAESSPKRPSLIVDVYNSPVQNIKTFLANENESKGKSSTLTDDSKYLLETEADSMHEEHGSQTESSQMGDLDNVPKLPGQTEAEDLSLEHHPQGKLSSVALSEECEDGKKMTSPPHLVSPEEKDKLRQEKEDCLSLNQGRLLTISKASDSKQQDSETSDLMSDLLHDSDSKLEDDEALMIRCIEDSEADNMKHSSVSFPPTNDDESNTKIEPEHKEEEFSLSVNENPVSFVKDDDDCLSKSDMGDKGDESQEHSTKHVQTSASISSDGFKHGKAKEPRRMLFSTVHENQDAFTFRKQEESGQTSKMYHKDQMASSSKMKTRTAEEANSADEFQEDKPKTDMKEEKKTPNQRHIEKLEQLLESLRNEIEKCQSKELALDDLDAEDSCYIYEDKLKRKFVAAWNKLCEITNRTVTTGRPTEKMIRYNGTRYKEINRRLQKFLNRNKIFPDFHDVKNIVKLTNKKCRLNMSSTMVNDTAREAFVDIGELLQTRRHQDFIATFGNRDTDTVRVEVDPYLTDPELRRKLDSNRKVARSNLEAVIAKYTKLQYEGNGNEEDDDDDEDGDGKDETDTEDENLKKSKKTAGRIDGRCKKSIIEEEEEEMPYGEMDLMPRKKKIAHLVKARKQRMSEGGGGFNGATADDDDDDGDDINIPSTSTANKMSESSARDPPKVVLERNPLLHTPIKQALSSTEESNVIVIEESPAKAKELWSEIEKERPETSDLSHTLDKGSASERNNPQKTGPNIKYTARKPVLSSHLLAVRAKKNETIFNDEDSNSSDNLINSVSKGKRSLAEPSVKIENAEDLDDRSSDDDIDNEDEDDDDAKNVDRDVDEIVMIIDKSDAESESDSDSRSESLGNIVSLSSEDEGENGETSCGKTRNAVEEKGTSSTGHILSNLSSSDNPYHEHNMKFIASLERCLKSFKPSEKVDLSSSHIERTKNALAHPSQTNTPNKPMDEKTQFMSSLQITRKVEGEESNKQADNSSQPGYKKTMCLPQSSSLARNVSQDSLNDCVIIDTPEKGSIESQREAKCSFTNEICSNITLGSVLNRAGDSSVLDDNTSGRTAKHLFPARETSSAASYEQIVKPDRHKVIAGKIDVPESLICSEISNKNENNARHSDSRSGTEPTVVLSDIVDSSAKREKDNSSIVNSPEWDDIIIVEGSQESLASLDKPNYFTGVKTLLMEKDQIHGNSTQSALPTKKLKARAQDVSFPTVCRKPASQDIYTYEGIASDVSVPLRNMDKNISANTDDSKAVGPFAKNVMDKSDSAGNEALSSEERAMIVSVESSNDSVSSQTQAMPSGKNLPLKLKTNSNINTCVSRIIQKLNVSRGIETAELENQDSINTYEDVGSLLVSSENIEVGSAGDASSQHTGTSSSSTESRELPKQKTLSGRFVEARSVGSPSQALNQQNEKMRESNKEFSGEKLSMREAESVLPSTAGSFGVQEMEISTDADLALTETASTSTQDCQWSQSGQGLPVILSSYSIEASSFDKDNASSETASPENTMESTGGTLNLEEEMNNDDRPLLSKALPSASEEILHKETDRPLTSRTEARTSNSEIDLCSSDLSSDKTRECDVDFTAKIEVRELMDTNQSPETGLENVEDNLNPQFKEVESPLRSYRDKTSTKQKSPPALADSGIRDERDHSVLLAASAGNKEITTSTKTKRLACEDIQHESSVEMGNPLEEECIEKVIHKPAKSTEAANEGSNSVEMTDPYHQEAENGNGKGTGVSQKMDNGDDDHDGDDAFNSITKMCQTMLEEASWESAQSKVVQAETSEQSLCDNAVLEHSKNGSQVLVGIEDSLKDDSSFAVQSDDEKHMENECGNRSSEVEHAESTLISRITDNSTLMEGERSADAKMSLMSTEIQVEMAEDIPQKTIETTSHLERAAAVSEAESESSDANTEIHMSPRNLPATASHSNTVKDTTQLERESETKDCETAEKMKVGADCEKDCAIGSPQRILLEAQVNETNNTGETEKQDDKGQENSESKREKNLSKLTVEDQVHTKSGEGDGNDMETYQPVVQTKTNDNQMLSAEQRKQIFTMETDVADVRNDIGGEKDKQDGTKVCDDEYDEKINNKVDGKDQTSTDAPESFNAALEREKEGRSEKTMSASVEHVDEIEIVEELLSARGTSHSERSKEEDRKLVDQLLSNIVLQTTMKSHSSHTDTQSSQERKAKNKISEPEDKPNTSSTSADKQKLPENTSEVGSTLETLSMENQQSNVSDMDSSGTAKPMDRTNAADHTPLLEMECENIPMDSESLLSSTESKSVTVSDAIVEPTRSATKRSHGHSEAGPPEVVIGDDSVNSLVPLSKQQKVVDPDMIAEIIKDALTQNPIRSKTKDSRSLKMSATEADDDDVVIVALTPRPPSKFAVPHQTHRNIPKKNLPSGRSGARHSIVPHSTRHGVPDIPVRSQPNQPAKSLPKSLPSGSMSFSQPNQAKSFAHQRQPLLPKPYSGVSERAPYTKHRTGANITNRTSPHVRNPKFQQTSYFSSISPARPKALRDQVQSGYGAGPSFSLQAGRQSSGFRKDSIFPGSPAVSQRSHWSSNVPQQKYSPYPLSVSSVKNGLKSSGAMSTSGANHSSSRHSVSTRQHSGTRQSSTIASSSRLQVAPSAYLHQGAATRHHADTRSKNVSRKGKNLDGVEIILDSSDTEDDSSQGTGRSSDFSLPKIVSVSSLAGSQGITNLVETPQMKPLSSRTSERRTRKKSGDIIVLSDSE